MKKEKYRKAVFAVVYATTEHGVQFALLKRKKHWKGWEFTKGKIESFETKRHAAKREVYEETGLKATKVKKLPYKGEYKYNKPLKDRPGVVGQTFHLFAVEVEKPLDGKIKVDPKEHNYGKWFSFKEAHKKLTWPNQRKALKIVNDFFKGKK